MSGSSPQQLPFLRTGFVWSSADAYLFDIDGTLLNSRDSVHYQAFQNAVRSVCGFEAGIDGVPVHGNTDPLILREILRRAGLSETAIALHLPQIIERMCREVERRRRDLVPELCPSVIDLLTYLRRRGKLLVAASGNLEPIGWAKLERAGIKEMFGFGSFSWPRESRAEIFSHGVALTRQIVGPQAFVYAVGDTPADIQAARTAGIPVIALATGIFSFEQLLPCNPDACMISAADLLALDNTGSAGAIPRAT
jgi:phosphoglycolate phosphatase-like HAD superfamily hydrolase